MEQSPFYPYPPRPGMFSEAQSANVAEPYEKLSEPEIQAVIEFEHQLYAGQLERDDFPSAVAFQEECAAKSHPIPPFETIWQKQMNSTTLGVSYFMTEKGRQALLKATGFELQAETVEDCLQQLSQLDIRSISSKELGKLEGESVGFEEEQLTQAFLQSDFDERAVPEPQFLTIYKNPEVIAEKLKSYRQLKGYTIRALQDLREGNAQDDSQTTRAKMLLATLYRRRLNYFISETYVEAHKFAYQTQLSEKDDHRILLDDLKRQGLPGFSKPPATQVARNLVRMDRYRYGVSRDENGKFTWLSQEALSEAQLVDQEPDDAPVDRAMYADIRPEQLNDTEIDGTTFGELLRGVLAEYDLLSEDTEWDRERQTPAEDGKWQVIADGSFKSLAVDDKQRIMQVPDKPASLMRVVTLANHEVTHVLQHTNKRQIGKLAILEQIGLDNVSDQTESGGIWQENEARQRLTGRVSEQVTGIGYLKTLTAKTEGASFGRGVKLYYEDIRREEPHVAPEKAAAQAVNRARRAYRAGGFEYARDLPVLTNSQSLSYLEQGLIYKNLSPERRRLLFIGGVSIPNLIELSSIGLVDFDQMFIPEKMPWELLYPSIKKIIQKDQH